MSGYMSHYRPDDNAWERDDPRTPEIKRSNRVLVQKKVNESDTFKPRRRSFGIVLKEYDPRRSPARSRRSISRQGSISSRDVSRSSSVSSMARRKRKSCSMGDIVKEVEFEDNHETGPYHRNMSSSPRRRSLSRGSSVRSRDSSDSSEQFHTKSTRPVQRQRSNEISENALDNVSNNTHTIANVDSVSTSMPRTTKRLHVSETHSNDMDSRSRAAQYEIVQKRVRKNVDNIQHENQYVQRKELPEHNYTHGPNALIHQSAYPNKNISTHNNGFEIHSDNRDVNMNSINSQQSGYWSDNRNRWMSDNEHAAASYTSRIDDHRKYDRLSSTTTDDGTDIDDRQWRNTHLNTQSEIKSTSYRGHQLNKPQLDSFNDSNLYSNMEEMKPMLPPKVPPKLPPKTLNQQLGNLCDNRRFDHHEKENFVQNHYPPRPPPKSTSVQMQTSYMQDSQRTRQFNYHPQRNQYNEREESRHFHSNTNGKCEQQWRREIPLENVMNVQRVKDIQRDQQWETKRYVEDACPGRSQRQFMSTANFQTARILPNNERMSVTEKNIRRAKSTDALTFAGFVKSDPEVDNTEPTSNIKKAKSNLVLDDVSLGSYDGKVRLSSDHKRGKLESWSGTLHLLTMCSALLTTVTMALVTREWDRHADKCPLYVESNLQHDRFWGNPNLVPCYITAYFPLIVVTISLTLIFIHGGLLFFWRSDRKSSGCYMTRSFGLTIMFMNIVSFMTALAVACTLSDGLRQTCLSFKLISDIDYRPTSCQNGLDGLDLNYNIEGTFYLIIFGIIGAWLAVIFTSILCIMYFIRVGCCRCNIG